jgi:hypothetical protein
VYLGQMFIPKEFSEIHIAVIGQDTSQPRFHFPTKDYLATINRRFRTNHSNKEDRFIMLARRFLGLEFIYHI